MSGPMQGVSRSTRFAATAGAPARGVPGQAAGSRGNGWLTRAARWAAAGTLVAAAAVSTQAGGFAQASGQGTPPAPRPAQAGHSAPKHYYYATAFDSGNARHKGPDAAHAEFLARTDHLVNKSDHSDTEIFTRDAAGNAVELGVTTDTFWLPNAQPHLFVSSWTHGKWNGYDTNAGFVTTSSSVKPGVTEPRLGKYTEYGYKYSKGKMWVSYNNVYIGYFPARIWPGGWGHATESQTYAEVYRSGPGRTLPTMNGSVRNYATSSGSHYSDFGVSSPYKIHNSRRTGFGFSGGTG